MKKDIWVVILDIIAVNLSYFLAIMIRFFVNGFLRAIAVERYMPAYIGFAPWYTVLCLLIFMAWRLYGGLWRYAGINDMNRIILANVCTTLVYVTGSCLFFTRMAISYYIIGAVSQFVFIVSIRFGYRALLVEKKRISYHRLNMLNAVVIGSGENGRRVVKTLEEAENYRPVAIVGNGSGAMDGIPITTMDQINWKDISAVFIADPLLSTEERTLLRKQCGDDIEFHDYTGYFSNLGGRISLTELLAIIHTPFIIELEGKETEYSNGEEALSALTEKYSIEEIEAIKIKIKHSQKPNTQDALAQAYAAVLGDEPQEGGSI